MMAILSKKPQIVNGVEVPGEMSLITTLFIPPPECFTAIPEQLLNSTNIRWPCIKCALETWVINGRVIAPQTAPLWEGDWPLYNNSSREQKVVNSSSKRAFHQQIHNEEPKKYLKPQHTAKSQFIELWFTTLSTRRLLKIHPRRLNNSSSSENQGRWSVQSLVKTVSHALTLVMTHNRCLGGPAPTRIRIADSTQSTRAGICNGMSKTGFRLTHPSRVEIEFQSRHRYF